jgi:hypothetical protein
VAAITITKNTTGQSSVEMGSDMVLTVERFRTIQAMQTQELKLLPTHEKVIWLRWMIDSNTPSVAAGSNSLVINRDNLIPDAM